MSRPANLLRHQWADKIRRRFTAAVEAVIEVGNHLLAAKAELPHGEFERMIAEDLGWHPSTARRLMAIARLPVARLSAPAAHLHLWTTAPFLFEAKAVLDAWGFVYKSMLVWVKPQLGLGIYWRTCHEILLLGVRGKCPFRKHAFRSWLEADRSGHSRKPDAVRSMIEAVSPAPRLELFSRETRPGWVVWGDEIDRRVLARSACQELLGD